MTSMPRDAEWMRAAIALARSGLGRVWPNPSVGCIIVKNNRCIARARTADHGRPHAETQALAIARSAAQGATAYVTLEPCAHTGKTGPCAQALIDAGIARVVIGATDPDPRVAGRGIAMLKDANIAVETDVCATQALDANAGFIKRTTHGLPWLTLKLAATLDGKIAMQNGQSKWITGPSARTNTHLERARHDAVLVGVGTVRADDPSLDVRLPGTAATPLRIIFDTKLSTPPDAKLIKTAQKHPTWIVTAAKNIDPGLQSAGVKIIQATTQGAHLDCKIALQKLADEGLTRIYCEGGATLAASLIQAGLVDQINHYTAGKLIGENGLSMIADLGLTDLANAPKFTLMQSQKIGNDYKTTWRPESS
jgi:diaminohydroxyphosphoribosylaminopyrimidine deaminase/5-amino-6-(5-phosphoribosylamino)uracil reductase